jgi:hypothetical protein
MTTKRYFINQFDNLEDMEHEQKRVRRNMRFGGGRVLRTRLRGRSGRPHVNEGRRRHLARGR